MRQKLITSIITNAENLSTAAANLLNILSTFYDTNKIPFDIKSTICSTDSSTSQVISRIHATVGIITEFNHSTRADLVPLYILTNLQSAIEDTKNSIINLCKKIEHLKKSEGGLRSFNYSNFQAQTNNGNMHNLEENFRSIYNSCETLLIKFFECLHILKPRSAYSFQAAASALSSIIDDANEKLTSLKKSLNQISISENNLVSKEEESAKHLEEIKRLKNDSDNDRKTIADYLAQSTQGKTSIQAILEDASKLQSTVNSYQEKFNIFEKKMNDREHQFAVGSADLAALIQLFESQKSEISNIINKSNKMLKSATVAGLASNFMTIKDQLTDELSKARLAFYVGIFFLTISALPLFAFVLMPILQPVIRSIFPETAFEFSNYAPNSSENAWQYLGQVLARITILLPAAWFVSFATIRHSSLFRLREHYSYKYSMAVAVEGFKQQAPIYEQEIAALVLEQLAFNPADKLNQSKDKNDINAPGISGFLLKKIRSKIDSIVSEERK
ncbi:hypothetical protein [Oceanibaculum indicum]|uniref:Uncharacterized protein n=1 Tax=Oceanibaculum indicum TaxID=526216 RepID=A0A420WRX4_9PROT|nr:hypothetical protein [Oceanibaculum indicum]RKQ73739.1 hypothetical protein BCL74_1530 [Oceanibaculum indicum]